MPLFEYDFSISEITKVSKNAPLIAPFARVSGVSHLVRYAASPVSLKYTFGVFIALLSTDEENGYKRYIIPEASRTDSHLFIVL